MQSLLEGASQRRAGIFATVIGGIAFLVAATGAFLELQVALNTIWRVKPNPGANFKAFLMDRAALVRPGGGDRFSAAGIARGHGRAGRAQRLALRPVPRQRRSLWNVVSTLVSLVVTTGLFALLFRFLPDVRLRWRDVTTGAVVTAVLFTIGQQVIGLYLGQSSIASSYGAAGSMMILLLWVYYSCQILLFGAEFTRVYVQRHGARPKPESFAVKDPDAIRPK